MAFPFAMTTGLWRSSGLAAMALAISLCLLNSWTLVGLSLKLFLIRLSGSFNSSIDINLIISSSERG